MLRNAALVAAVASAAAVAAASDAVPDLSGAWKFDTGNCQLPPRINVEQCGSTALLSPVGTALGTLVGDPTVGEVVDGTWPQLSFDTYADGKLNLRCTGSSQTWYSMSGSCVDQNDAKCTFSYSCDTDSPAGCPEQPAGRKVAPTEGAHGVGAPVGGTYTLNTTMSTCLDSKSYRVHQCGSTAIVVPSNRAMAPNTASVDRFGNVFVGTQAGTTTMCATGRGAVPGHIVGTCGSLYSSQSCHIDLMCKSGACAGGDDA